MAGGQRPTSAGLLQRAGVGQGRRDGPGRARSGARASPRLPPEAPHSIGASARAWRCREPGVGIADRGSVAILAFGPNDAKVADGHSLLRTGATAPGWGGSTSPPWCHRPLTARRSQKRRRGRAHTSLRPRVRAHRTDTTSDTLFPLSLPARTVHPRPEPGRHRTATAGDSAGSTAPRLDRGHRRSHHECGRTGGGVHMPSSPATAARRDEVSAETGPCSHR